MFIEAIILGLLIGIIRGGRVSNLQNYNIRGWYLIIVAVIVQMLPIFMKQMGFLENNLHVVGFFGLVLMIVVVFINVRVPFFPVILVGGLLNIIAMILNSFKMPVMLEKLEGAGLTDLMGSILNGSILNYSSAEGANIVAQYLGKIYAFPEIYPLASIVSIGDIIMSIGLMLSIQSIMMTTFFKKRGSMVQFSYRSKF